MVSHSASSQASASLADFLGLLRRRRALISMLFAIVVITTLVVTALLPRWYLATTKIRVEKPEGEVSLFEAQSTGAYDPYFLQDQLKIMQYEKILYPVIESLGLNAKLGAELGSTTPLTAATSYLYLVNKMLRIEAQRNSSVIEINVYSRDSSMAASIANEIARVYSEDRIAFATASQREGLAQLREELAAQERVVSQQRDVVENLRRELNIAGIDLNARSSDLEVETLRQMRANLIALKVDLSGRKTDYESFSAVPRDQRIAMINSESIADTNIQNLLQAYLVADQNVTRLQGQLGEAHPDLRAALNNRTVIRRQLDELLDGYELSLEREYRVAEARVRELEANLEEAESAQIQRAQERMRPFDEATQKLDDETRLLTTLNFTLRQREIDFQVPKRTIEILNTAEPPRRPAKPSWPLNSLLAGFFGLLLGVGVAVLMEHFDTSFRSMADVEARLRLPVLGVIPLTADPRAGPEGDPAEGEPYRVLQTGLKLLLPADQPASLAVFSAGPGEGKSTTLYHLARFMAEAGERVLLIDSDLRRPTQHQLMGVPRQPGLSDLLAGAAGADAVIRKAGENLDFIPSGGQSGYTLGLIHAERLKQLLKEWSGRYDRIIFDSPPIIGVSDSSVIASVVDGAILLIQHRRNPAAMVERARQILDNLKTRVLGVVLNQVPSDAGEDYGYYTSNYSYYSEGGRKGSRRSRSGGKDDGEDRLELKE